MLCTLLGIWCSASASMFGDQRVMCAQPDITAYELALLLENARTPPDQLYKLHPGLLRHTVASGTKCEAK
jgi:hypothetical protein